MVVFWDRCLYSIYIVFPTQDHLTIAHFADDVAILSKGTCESAAEQLNIFCEKVSTWCKQWRVIMNSQKSNLVKFTYKRNTVNYPVILCGSEVPMAQSVRYLGLILDSKITWHNHISAIVKRIRHRIYLLKHIIQDRSPLPLHYKRRIYISIVRPVWQCGCSIWGSASASQIRRIQVMQNRYLGLMSGAPWYISNKNLHDDLCIPEVMEVLRQSYIRLYNSFLNHINPPQDPAHRRLKRERHSDMRL
ncbi:hypothetical protein ANN_16784 [Periplaneta americana]|uniref:Reverse transcriptase domain-containing protein n=1 Tax=Periplaneta americana TaxID=6978 RepID=A0ABQ8SRV7_PERAM|nr:hypothetical protein ANN_16784 [Periplaneta americana]